MLDTKRNNLIWIWMNKETGDCISTKSLSEFIHLIGADYPWGFNKLMSSKLYRNCDYIFWACGEVKN